MQTLMPWIAVAVTIVAGWALIKRYQTHMVLLLSLIHISSASRCGHDRNGARRHDGRRRNR